MKTKIIGIEVDDSMVVNVEDCIYQGEFNPHNVRPWLIYGLYGAYAIVFASNEQDALDIAADADKLKACASERLETDTDYLGNAGDPYDLTDVGITALKIPKRSWLAEFLQS